MVNRKENKAANRAGHSDRPAGRPAADKPHRPYRRFVISRKARNHNPLPAQAPPEAQPKPDVATQAKAAYASSHGTPAAGKPGQVVDLTETIKTLLHLSHEHGHVTYDDINDVLPDGLTPDDLDDLYTKLRNLDIEIVDHAEVERAKPAEPEEEEDTRLEVLDDPVRMYMNQMGKVPLLTREQEVEICKRIEEAEIAMKTIVYSLGFTPKEHFDRVIVGKKIANRERHLRDLRKFIKKVHALDQKVDAKYFAWQKALQKGRKEKLARELKKMSAKLQELFLKFFYKQKVVEEMIVGAGNVHEKFQASLRHIQELEALRTTAQRRGGAAGERA